MATATISGSAASKALADTWHALVGIARDDASEITRDLDALATEMLPQVTELVNESVGPAGPGRDAAVRALAEVKGMTEAEIDRLGLQTVNSFAPKLAEGLQLAGTWLGILLKAAVVA